MLKENWTNTDKFNYNDYNIIITNIINLCKKAKIEVAEKYQKQYFRKIKVGDDLSGKTLHMNFDGKTAYNSLGTEEYLNNIIVSNNYNIHESVFNLGQIYKLLEMSDDTCLFSYSYSDYIEDKSPAVNLTQCTLPSDFGTITAIDTASYFYNNILIESDILEIKKRGDFLYSDDLNEIENMLKQICSQLFLNYNKKTWYYLSIISYDDVNKWCKAINSIKFKKYSDYVSNTYSELANKNYKQILNGFEEV